MATLFAAFRSSLSPPEQIPCHSHMGSSSPVFFTFLYNELLSGAVFVTDKSRGLKSPKPAWDEISTTQFWVVEDLNYQSTSNRPSRTVKPALYGGLRSCNNILMLTKLQNMSIACIQPSKSCLSKCQNTSTLTVSKFRLAQAH